METTRFSKIVELIPQDNKRLRNLCGIHNANIKLIEERLDVTIKQRGFHFSIIGQESAVLKTDRALTYLYEQAEARQILTPPDIHLYLQGAKDSSATQVSQDHHMDIHLKHTTITARGKNQLLYLENIEKHDINFAVGPAGTGKTYLAVACAVNALQKERVSRIILVRPIVEAGEKLGFLPGDLSQKVHPYLRPLYDALYEMYGFDVVNQLIERDIIELAPLAYMRGRTLNDSFIILDEGQNTTIEQMKMFLTRIGFNSKVVITGDITQIDLTNRRDSGLVQAVEILSDVKGISFTQFQASDVVRHPLVQSIVEAYERYIKK